jgi:hypothetical protein
MAAAAAADLWQRGTESVYLILEREDVKSVSNKKQRALAQGWKLIRFAHRELEMNCARVNKNHAIPSQRNKLRGRIQALHWGTVLTFDQRSLSG